MNLNGKALKELALSVGRFLYFGLLGVVSTVLASLLTDESLTNSYVDVNGLRLPVGVLIVAGVGGLIKLVDRYRHVNPEVKSNGLAPKFLQGGK